MNRACLALFFLVSCVELHVSVHVSDTSVAVHVSLHATDHAYDRSYARVRHRKAQLCTGVLSAWNRCTMHRQTGPT